MAALVEAETYEAEIYQLEITDPVIGGPDGIDNLQGKQLANRTNWLKAKIDSILSMSFINTAVAENPGDTDLYGFYDSLTGMVRKVSHTTLKALFFSSPNLTETPTINGINLSPNKGRNKLINANGLVNQRSYVSGTATTVANQYTLDRWRVVTSGQNLTFSTTGGVTTFTAPAGGVEQVVENLNVIGGEYTLTIGGTATALVSQSTDNVTYTTVTPIGGVYTITGGNYVRVRFSSGTFSKPQFEEGRIATTFEKVKISLDHKLCTWYFEPITLSSNTINLSGVATTASAGYFPTPLLPKRVSPTLIVTGVANAMGTLANGLGTSAFTSISVATYRGNQVMLTFAGSSGFTIGQGIFVSISAGSTLLQFSSEL